MNRIRAITAWAFSRQGQHDLAAAVAAATALYTGLHKAGVL